MKNLKLLFRYASKSNRPQTKKLNLNSILGWILSLCLMGLIAFPMISIFYGLFKVLAIPASSLGLPYNGYLVDIYMFVMSLTFGLMLMLTLVPGVIFSLFEAKDMDFLLSMPIKKPTIFLFKALMSLSTGFLPLIMLIIISVCYAVALKINMFIAVLGILLFLTSLLLLSLSLGSAMTRFINRSTARIMSQLFLYISLIVYVIIINVFPRQTQDPQAIAESFGGVFKLIEGRFAWLIPTNWALYATKGDFRVLALLALLCLISLGIVINITELTNLSSGRGKSRKKHRVELSRYPIIKKELRLIFKNSQNLFIITYAIIFPIVMTFANRSAISGAIFISILAPIYSATLALQLIAEERKVWPLPKLFPLGMYKIVAYKAIMSGIIFTIGYFLVLLFSYILVDMHFIMFLSVIPMSVVMLYSSTFGLNLFLNDPNRTISQKGVQLKFREGLFLQLRTIFLGLGIIIPFGMWGGIYVDDPSLSLITELGWYRLIAWGLPWVVMGIAVLLLRHTFKKINTKVDAWE